MSIRDGFTEADRLIETGLPKGKPSVVSFPESADDKAVWFTAAKSIAERLELFK